MELIMDYRTEIALLDLNSEVPEVKTVKERKYYVPVPPELNRRGKFERTPEMRAKHSESMRRRWQGPERDRLLEAVRYKSPEQRQRMSETMKKRFENPEYYRRQCEHLRNIKRRTLTDEEKQRISNRQRGDFWINNGVEQHKVHAGTPIPEGYVRGRLPFSEDAKRNMRESSKKFWSTHTMVVVPKDTNSDN